jgi:hypothetical protein
MASPQIRAVFTDEVKFIIFKSLLENYKLELLPGWADNISIMYEKIDLNNIHRYNSIVLYNPSHKYVIKHTLGKYFNPEVDSELIEFSAYTRFSKESDRLLPGRFYYTKQYLSPTNDYFIKKSPEFLEMADDIFKHIRKMLKKMPEVERG